MPNLNEKFGRNAGKIWVALNTKGPLNENSLIKNTKLTENELYVAVGWLARENKIYKDGNLYRLGQTNLTGKIGVNAGKVWNTLNTQKEVDISSISRIAQIDLRDAYLALGWLARENKIEDTKPKTNQFKYKLR
jgi:hypothetical protein